MSPQNRENLYDYLCAALRKPLSQGGYLALTAALRDQGPRDIAAACAAMTDDEALVVFNWLDNDRASLLLGELSPEQAGYLLSHAPPGRIAGLYATENPLRLN